VLRRVIEQARLACVGAGRDPREGSAQRIGVERIEQEDDQIARWICERARIFVRETDVGAAGVEATQLLQVLFRGLVEGGRDLDADDALERRSHRQEDGAAETAPDVDERRAADHVVRNARDQIGEVVDRHGLVVGRVGGRFADILGVEVAEEEQRLGHDIVFGIETSAGKSATHASILT